MFDTLMSFHDYSTVVNKVLFSKSKHFLDFLWENQCEHYTEDEALNIMKVFRIKPVYDQLTQL